MNYEEILNVLKENCGVENFAYDDVDYESLGLGKVEEVHSTGGMDAGSNWSSVKHFVDHDVYIRVTGWYQSHYGTDFQGWEEEVSEVKPKEKTVTVYE